MTLQIPTKKKKNAVSYLLQATTKTVSTNVLSGDRKKRYMGNGTYFNHISNEALNRTPAFKITRKNEDKSLRN